MTDRELLLERDIRKAEKHIQSSNYDTKLVKKKLARLRKVYLSNMTENEIILKNRIMKLEFELQYRIAIKKENNYEV